MLVVQTNKEMQGVSHTLDARICPAVRKLCGRFTRKDYGGKMKCDELKTETIVPQGCTITLQMYPKGEVDAAIAELKAENERLKKCEIWMKRALWLARAERAKECHFMWCQLIYDKKYGIVKFNVKKRWWSEDVKIGQTLHTPQGWADVWDEVEYRCSKKAEEYK